MVLFNIGLFSSPYVILQGLGDGAADVLWSEMRLHWDEPFLPSEPRERRQVTGKMKPSLLSTGAQTPMNS